MYNQRYYQYVNDSLNAIYQAVEESLDIHERLEVRRFIDVGEYGIALEAICAYLTPYAPISADICRKINDVGSKMKMDKKIWGFLCER